MTTGRDAEEPYRVRTGAVWYLVDPTFPSAAIEPGDIVVVYPVSGDAVVAILGKRPGPDGPTWVFATQQGERFEVAANDIGTVHLATVDEIP